MGRGRRSAKGTRLGHRPGGELGSGVLGALGLELLEPRLQLSGSGLWQHLPAEMAGAEQTATLRAVAFELYDLKESAWQEFAAGVPHESTAGGKSVVLEVPNPDNVLQRFEVVETAVMHPELAAKFPEIRTYRGQGIDDPTSTIQFDATPWGFHAQVLATGGTWYIDPYFHLQTDVYASYYRTDFRIDPQVQDLELDSCFDCGCDDGHGDGLNAAPHSVADPMGPVLSFGEDGGGAADSVEQQLRTYQLAVAATGEYTAFFGGTVAGGMAAIVTAVNRVTGIYETELSVRMQLVPNNDLLVYTNSATDPYSNNSGGTMLGQNQSNIDAVIGNANYDVGHVFSTGGGGVAFLGVVGETGFKARGVTGLPNPVGDVFYVDYVAHEMGHQFGGNHTFNGDSGSCSGSNRNGATAYEPGSGTTIMAYAGICGNDNLQLNSDPYFHHESIREIRNYVTTGTGNSSATITNTGNEIPTVLAGADYVIPANTPFELTASGADLGGGSLTYSWEERDLGPQRDLSAADNGSSPLFRVWNPTSNPTRVFPRLSDLLNNTINIGEKLPSTNRTMTFRVTARDNFAGGGGTASDDMTVTSVTTGAAFAVTLWNSPANLTGGSSQTVTWNVAGTTAAPINAANVDLLWSIDGGLTFPYLLASAVPNDGSHAIAVPNIPTTQGRLKVRGSGNIFFDVNNANVAVARGNVLVAGQIANLTDAWQTITLAQWFADPIVNLGPVNFAAGDPGVVRIRNVTGNSFEVQFAEWDYLDGVHPAESVSYLVVDRGVTTLSDGKVLLADRVDVDQDFSAVPFAAAFSGTPVVLATVASAHGEETVAARLRDVADVGFSLAIQEEEANDGVHVPETVHYLAALPGSGNSSGLNYEVGLISRVTNKAFPNRLTQTFVAVPRVLAAMQTFNYADTSSVQLRRLNAKQITPFIEEEQSADSERAHGGEVVGFFAFRLNTALTESAGTKFDPSAERFFQSDPWSHDVETTSHERSIAGRPAPAMMPVYPDALSTRPERDDVARPASVWSHYRSFSSEAVQPRRPGDAPASENRESSVGSVNEKRSKTTFDLESQYGNGISR